MADTDVEFQFGLPRAEHEILSLELRTLLEALARNNVTSNINKPVDPRNGMFRVLATDLTNVKLQLYWGSWRTLFENVQSSLPVARVAKQDFLSSTTWVFDHNFNANVLVQVKVGNEVVLPYKIEHASLNRVIVTHSTAKAGSIIVVG